MGGKKKTQTVYAPTPAPTATPQMTPEQLSVQQDLQKQLADVQSASNQQLEGMRTQYAQNAQTSASMLENLRAQIEQQRVSGERQTEDLRLAREAQARQSAATQDVLQGQQARYADERAQQMGNYSSMFTRLQRRRQNRQTRY